jgi:hypothetical protein
MRHDNCLIEAIHSHSRSVRRNTMPPSGGEGTKFNSALAPEFRAVPMQYGNGRT